MNFFRTEDDCLKCVFYELTSRLEHDMINLNEEGKELAENPNQSIINALSRKLTDIKALWNSGKIVINTGNGPDKFPVEDWQLEVANGDTVLGYSDWRQSLL